MTNDLKSQADLQAVLGQVLEAACLENDVCERAMLALAFCDLLSPRLDHDQRSAVKAAREFWTFQRSEARDSWLKAYSSKLDSQGRLDTVDRIVWSALTAPDGLSSYMGEFLVGLAFEAGLSRSAVLQALSSSVPGFGDAWKHRTHGTF